MVQCSRVSSFTCWKKSFPFLLLSRANVRCACCYSARALSYSMQLTDWFWLIAFIKQTSVDIIPHYCGHGARRTAIICYPIFYRFSKNNFGTGCFSIEFKHIFIFFFEMQSRKYSSWKIFRIKSSSMSIQFFVCVVFGPAGFIVRRSAIWYIFFLSLSFWLEKMKVEL